MKRITKNNFRTNEIVIYNLSNIYSCMKICHRKDLETESLIKVMWHEFRNYCMESHSMQEISDFCKELNTHFYKYFKIVAR